ncbi:MAG: hypothetical protein J2P28_22360 [Actinobacteria bacterium]|nr:hypothetical protein [Actinomycetota bacterium]
MLSTTQAGNGAFKWLASNTPVANVAAAGGGGGQATSVLPPNTISVASPVTLVNKVQLNVDVTVTCGPFAVLSSSSANVTVTEASGHVVSQALGQIPALTCDGSPHTYALSLIADNAPFRPGKAVASSSAFAFGIVTPLSPLVSVTGTNTQTVAIAK